MRAFINLLLALFCMFYGIYGIVVGYELVTIVLSFVFMIVIGVMAYKSYQYGD
jgi:hypothetical protein